MSTFDVEQLLESTANPKAGIKEEPRIKDEPRNNDGRFSRDRYDGRRRRDDSRDRFHGRYSHRRERSPEPIKRDRDGDTHMSDDRRRFRSRSRDREYRRDDRYGQRRAVERDDSYRPRGYRGERDDRGRDRPAHRESPHRRSGTPEPRLTEDERDKRTVFVQQLSQRLRSKELIAFFEQAGPVKEAQIVKDRVSGRSKG